MNRFGSRRLSKSGMKSFSCCGECRWSGTGRAATPWAIWQDIPYRRGAVRPRWASPSGAVRGI